MKRELAEKPSACLGGAIEQRDARRRRTGGRGRPAERWAGAQEMAGMWPGQRGPEDKKPGVATQALHKLQLTWNGWVGPRKVRGNAVVSEAGEGKERSMWPL